MEGARRFSFRRREPLGKAAGQSRRRCRQGFGRRSPRRSLRRDGERRPCVFVLLHASRPARAGRAEGRLRTTAQFHSSRRVARGKWLADLRPRPADAYFVATAKISQEALRSEIKKLL